MNLYNTSLVDDSNRTGGQKGPAATFSRNGHSMANELRSLFPRGQRQYLAG